MVCYVVATVAGGRLADHWGRARTAVLGNAISLTGCIVALATGSAGVALAATWMTVGGAAMFFPGCAGLFSDAEAAGEARPLALHVKISGYNLGWSSGALIGFCTALAIATAPMAIGYSLMAVAFIGSAAQMLRFQKLPPRPPAAVGDRSPHPAIPWLIIMHRLNVVLAAGIGMSLIGMLDQVLREHLAGDAAVRISRMVLSGYAEHEFQKIEATLTDKKHPADWVDPAPIVSVIASSADKKIILLENGDVVAESNLTIAGDGPFGGHVLVLQGAHGDTQGMKWSAISHEAETGNSLPGDRLLQRIKADPDFIAKVSERMHPGMIVILTDAPLHPDTRSGKDFVIMS